MSLASPQKVRERKANRERPVTTRSVDGEWHLAAHNQEPSRCGLHQRLMTAQPDEEQAAVENEHIQSSDDSRSIPPRGRVLGRKFVELTLSTRVVGRGHG